MDRPGGDQMSSLRAGAAVRFGAVFAETGNVKILTDL